MATKWVAQMPEAATRPVIHSQAARVRPGAPITMP